MCRSPRTHRPNTESVRTLLYIRLFRTLLHRWLNFADLSSMWNADAIWKLKIGCLSLKWTKWSENGKTAYWMIEVSGTTFMENTDVQYAIIWPSLRLSPINFSNKGLFSEGCLATDSLMDLVRFHNIKLSERFSTMFFRSRSEKMVSTNIILSFECSSSLGRSSCSIFLDSTKRYWLSSCGSSI